MLLASPAVHGDDRPPQGRPHPTLAWALVQALPSPGLIVSGGQVDLALEWQLSPVLWAFGQRPELPRWRSFIVEPMVRYGGSIELYYAPEYLGLDGPFATRWGLRVGGRAYLPVVQHGDNLAVSVGVSDLMLRGEHAAVLDTGVHVLYGVAGLTLGWSPRLLGAPTWLLGLHLRYF